MPDSKTIPARRPLIGISACRRYVEDAVHVHWSAEKYIAAVEQGAGGLPIIVPAFGARGLDAGDLAAIVDRLDGLLLTGSRSNVAPHHYGKAPFDGDFNDPDRDATTLPLIRAAIEAGVPLLAICRGIQELNVALGGTLYQQVHELRGRLDHRSDKTVPHEERYVLRHTVKLRDGSLLSELAGGAEEVRVNSLHAQAIETVAPGVAVDGVAEDGTIEAIAVEDSAAFAMGVQWHAEWGYRDDPLSAAIFRAFGNAAAARAARRSGQAALPSAAE